MCHMSSTWWSACLHHTQFCALEAKPALQSSAQDPGCSRLKLERQQAKTTDDPMWEVQGEQAGAWRCRRSRHIKALSAPLLNCTFLGRRSGPQDMYIASFTPATAEGLPPKYTTQVRACVDSECCLAVVCASLPAGNPRDTVVHMYYAARSLMMR